MMGWWAGAAMPEPPKYVEEVYDRNGHLWCRAAKERGAWTPDWTGYAVKWTSEAMRVLSPFTVRPRSRT